MCFRKCKRSTKMLVGTWCKYDYTWLYCIHLISIHLWTKEKAKNITPLVTRDVWLVFQPRTSAMRPWPLPRGNSDGPTQWTSRPWNLWKSSKRNVSLFSLFSRFLLSFFFDFFIQQCTAHVSCFMLTSWLSVLLKLPATWSGREVLLCLDWERHRWKESLDMKSMAV